MSDILRLTKARTVLTGGVRAGGAWALRFSPPKLIKFLAISGSGGWLRMEDETDFVRLDPGDVLLFADRRGFVIASDQQALPIDASTLFAGKVGTVVPITDDGVIQLVGGHVALDPTTGWMISSILPPLMHVGSAAPGAPILRWLVEQLAEEGFAGKLGADLAAGEIAQLLLVHILRERLSQSAALPPGALRAATDPQLSRALRLIHAEPERAWRLVELATAAAMSRTVFAERFRQATGLAPIAYLTLWRMLLAAHSLSDGIIPIGQLARSLGYASESAFSQAFKRVMGVPPSRHLSGREPASARRRM